MNLRFDIEFIEKKFSTISINVEVYCFLKCSRNKECLTKMCEIFCKLALL